MKTITITTNPMTGGFDNIIRVDNTFCEITKKGKTYIRAYYLNNNNSGYFYFNNTRYIIENFLNSVQAGRVTNIFELEKKKKLSEDMEGNSRAAGTKKTKIEVDFGTSKKVESKVEQPKSDNTIVKHYQYDVIKTCIKADIPVYLVGEAGTGKNFTLQEIAKDLNLTFYFTNSIQQEYKITGFIDAGGTYHETEFYKAFKNGGLFFLDELDASIPEVLVLLNAAIANKYFEFPTGRLDAHPDFRVVAAGNTSGSGANELYTGRLVLDSATLDRFVEIEFDYDRNIELSLAKGNTQLVNFTRSLREFCKNNGIRATFSYRMIISVTKLEAAGLDLKHILKIAVLKGMDKDTIRTLNVKDSGKYYYALKELQAAA
jgi:hypothetical protein